MKLEILKPARALNKAYLKQWVKYNQMALFKSELKKAFNHIDDKQDEEYHKNIILNLLTQVYYKDKYLVNVNKKEDLVIRLGNNTTDNVGVILEFKKPTEKRDMVSAEKPNVKALHELVLYYLRETIDKERHEIKHLIVSNIYEWFIFDELWFEKNIYKNQQLKKDYLGWKVSGHTTDHFYKLIAAKHLDLIEEDVLCTYFNIKDVAKILNKIELSQQEEETLINLYKILSPEHLLKQPFANDSNSLNKEFYNELLYVMGLEETKDTGKKIIERKIIEERNSGSLIENTITVLKRTNVFGYNTNVETENKYFELALELNITWLNRILFLKLLEGQLIKYNNNNFDFAFINTKRIKDFNELNELFFEVLAVPTTNRELAIEKLFKDIPYLNSALFEQTDLEKKHGGVNQLKDRLGLPIYANSVFKDDKGKRISGEISTLKYLFEFLNAYNFASESCAKIQVDNKSVINASVLGLIFEKINGYKDGSFFTPGFITMYMCKETINKVVVQKFNEANKWSCITIDNVKDLIDYTNKDERSRANDIINAIKICDPAVGSGHFLVSALNALIEVKSYLKILNYRNYTRVKGFKIEVANDELIITNEETDNIFDYKLNINGKPIAELQELQEALFYEKQNLIERCLFGVDINPKSVMICRLRLWIELLKNAFYTEKSNYKSLETLPNIDINIKCGNSLISRFAINDKNSMLPKDRPYIATLIEKYKILVDGYKNALDKKAKDDYRRQIAYSKTEFEKFTLPNDKEFLKLRELKAKLAARQFSFFFDESEKATWVTETETLSLQVIELEKQYTQKLKTIYENAFEWRFEFPEVLGNDGQFIGFDIVIGNPPYFSLNSVDKVLQTHLATANFKTFAKGADIYCLFIELAKSIGSEYATNNFIVSNKWLTAAYGQGTRNFLSEKTSNIFIIDFEKYQIFDEAAVDTCLISYANKNGKRTDFIQYDFKEKLVPIKDFLNNIHANIKIKTIDLESTWKLSGFAHIAIKNKLESIGTLLKNWDVHFYRGITTGYNEAFIIDTKQKNDLIKLDKKNAAIIKPILRGRDIKKYGFNYEGLWLLNTHNGVKKTNQMAIDVLKDYPTILKYLTPFQNKLETRLDKGKHWSNLRNCTYLNIFEKDKIVFTKASKIQAFAYDAGKHFVLNTSYILTGEKLKYLLAILNAKLIQFSFLHFYQRGGIDGEITIQAIENLPIIYPTAKQETAFIKLVDKILAAKNKHIEANTLKYENEIDEMVYELYKLTPAEKETVRNA